MDTSNTTYEEIFQCFLDNSGIDRTLLPENQTGMIRNAIRYYNNLVSEEDIISFNDKEEIIARKMTDSQLLVLSLCIKYIYLENELVEFEELWEPFQKEMGFKNYKDQIKSRERTLERTESTIVGLLNNMEDRSIM